MNEALGLVIMLCLVVLLGVLAKRINVPYPIACVAGGIALALIPGIPHARLDPEVIFLFVLPPLLYGAGFATDWHEFRRNFRAISFLAIGLVVLTTVAVAVFAHRMIPGFTWAIAFTLGAIVSPPDAVAAEAVFERLSVPRRVAAIISGECLVNDATALVLYRFAIAAAATGIFVPFHATLAFVGVSVGGILTGLAVAAAVELVVRLIKRGGYADPSIVSVAFFVVPFAAYISAEALHSSGVLAAVTAGITLGRRAAFLMDSETRIVSGSIWKMFVFLLNAFVFLLIGLQLPLIVIGLEPHLAQYLLDGSILCVLVIVVRMACVFAASYFLPALSWRANVVIGWAGMRGIISLAAALALPYELGLEGDFPVRAEIIFFTFCIILATLVGQGLTLGPLIKWLGVAETSAGHRQETELRIRALEEGVARLRELESSFSKPAEWELAGRSLGEYEERIGQLRGGLDGSKTAASFESATDRKLQREALEAERRAIIRMRAAGEIPDEIYRSIEYDLDLAALRLS